MSAKLSAMTCSLSCIGITDHDFVSTSSRYFNQLKYFLGISTRAQTDQIKTGKKEVKNSSFKAGFKYKSLAWELGAYPLL